MSNTLANLNEILSSFVAEQIEEALTAHDLEITAQIEEAIEEHNSNSDITEQIEDAVDNATSNLEALCETAAMEALRDADLTTQISEAVSDYFDQNMDKILLRLLAAAANKLAQ